MRINHSQVELAAQHKRMSYMRRRERLEINQARAQEPNEPRAESRLEGAERGLNLDVSGLQRRARQLQAGARDQVKLDTQGSQPCVCRSGEELPSITGDELLDTELIALALMISKLSGRPVYVSTIGRDMMQRAEHSQGLELPSELPSGAGSELSAQQGAEGGGAPSFRYELEEERLELERLQVEGGGSVTTRDGREIDFSVSIQMERFLASRTQLTISDEPLKDPLVIDLGTAPASFTGDTLRFDLDVDGEMDELPLLDKSGGYLVIDHNQNGEVDDGAEVIGALSGDGFADLMELDSDGDLWLDEDDEAFERVKVWRSTSEGRELAGLLEVGVGAIYLGAVEAEFSTLDEQHQTLAQQRAQSVYLSEEGEVGSVRRLDLRV